MDQTADKALNEIIENYKYDIRKENLSEVHYKLNIRCQFRLGSVIYNILVILEKLDDYQGRVPENDIKTTKEKLDEYYKKCKEMVKEVEKDLDITNPIIKGLYKDYERINSIKNVEEIYRQCSKTLIDKSIDLFVKLKNKLF